MISLGGVKLTAVSDDLCRRIEAEIPVADVLAHARLRRGEHFSWPYDTPERPIRIGALWWPWGASRWAQGHFLATENQCALLRELAYVSGVYTPLELVLADGRAGRQIATLLWMLPPRPLSQVAGANGLYLITVVDDRYFWWERSAAVPVTGGTTTWADWFAAAGLALDTTIDLATVAAAYLTPSTDLAGSYDHLPPLIDAACDSIGRRLVRSLDGSVTVQAPEVALAAEAAQYALWKRAKGGWLYLGDDVPNDHLANVPAQVDLVFRRTTAGVLTGVDFVESVTLASLALPEYVAGTGHDGVKVIRSTYPAEGGPPPTNAAQLTALAGQAAADWYRWRLASMDSIYGGIAPWEPTGCCDVEWSLSERQCETRVQFSHGSLETLYQHGEAAEPGGGGGTTIIVEELDGSPSYADTFKLIFHQGTGLFIQQYPGAGQVLVHLTPASTGQAGGVDTLGQDWIGIKGFGHGINVGYGGFSASNVVTFRQFNPSSASTTFQVRHTVTGQLASSVDLGFQFIWDDGYPSPGIYRPTLWADSGNYDTAGFGVIHVNTAYRGATGTNADGWVVKGGIVTTIGAAGGGSGTVTSFSAGTLSPIFTTSVATATTTPALSFALTVQNQSTVLAGPTSGASAAPAFRKLGPHDFNDQAANTVAAGPVSGADDIPEFRALVSADLPQFTSLDGGSVPASGGGTANFLRADGTWTVIGVDAGGTGWATYTTGDLLYASSNTVLSKRAIGTTGYPLVVSGGLPTWGQLGTAGIADGSITDAKLRDSVALSVIGRSANSTGDPADIASAVNGDVLLVNSSPAVVWGKISDNNVGTAIGPTKGGTGLSTYTAGDLLYASATDVLAKRAAGTLGHRLTMQAGLPAWRGGVGCFAYITSGKVVSTSTNTIVVLDGAIQSDAMWSSGAPSGVFAVEAGYYLVCGYFIWGSNSTGIRYMYFTKNGTHTGEFNVVGAAVDANGRMTMATVVELAVSDYVQIGVFQSSGSGIYLDGCFLKVYKLP